MGLPYCPLTPYVSRSANGQGILLTDARALMAPRSTQELVDRHRITSDQAIKILEGRLRVLCIGRSGFGDEDDARHFRVLLDSVFGEGYHLVRRAGIDVEAKLAHLTSATGGTVDFGVRRAAYLQRLPVVACIHGSLMSYVDPADPFMPGVVDTGEDYSGFTMDLADVVLSLPGGAFALYNDLPAALLKKKDVVFVHDPKVATHHTSIANGQTLLGNHVDLLVRERAGITRDLLERCSSWLTEQDIWDPHSSRAAQHAEHILRFGPGIGALCQILAERGQPMSPQEIWRHILVVERPDQWASYVLQKLGVVESLSASIQARTKEAVPAADAAKVLAGTRLNISIAGRSQWINKTSGASEERHIDLTLEQLSLLLTDSYGFSRREVGILHGMSNFGSDGAILRRFVLEGYKALGIVKPEWANFVDDKAKARSDFVLTEDTPEAFSRAYVGDGLGIKSDCLIIFEGNAGVKKHVQIACELGIPVILVPLTADPLFGNFWDVQKGRLFKDRLLNIGKWLHASERMRVLKEFADKLEELTTRSLERQSLQSALQELSVEFSRLAGEVETGQCPIGQEPKQALDEVKQVLGLVQEALDLYDLSTTVEGNPKIHVMKSATEIAALLNQIVLEKEQKKTSNLSGEAPKDQATRRGSMDARVLTLVRGGLTEGPQARPLTIGAAGVQFDARPRVVRTLEALPRIQSAEAKGPLDVVLDTGAALTGVVDDRGPQTWRDYVRVCAETGLLRLFAGSADAYQPLQKVWEVADLKATRERMLHGFWTSQDFMAMSDQTRATLRAFETENPGRGKGTVLNRLARSTHEAWLSNEKKQAYYTPMTQQVHDLLTEAIQMGYLPNVKLADHHQNAKQKFKVGAGNFQFPDDASKAAFAIRFQEVTGRSFDSGFKINTVGGEWEDLLAVQLTGTDEATKAAWNENRAAYLFKLQADNVAAVLHALQDQKIVVSLTNGSTADRLQSLVEMLRIANAAWRVNNPWDGDGTINSPLLGVGFALAEDGGIGIGDILRDAVTVRAALETLNEAYAAGQVADSTTSIVLSRAFNQGLGEVLEALTDQEVLEEAVRINTAMYRSVNPLAERKVG